LSAALTVSEVVSSRAVRTFESKSRKLSHLEAVIRLAIVVLDS
jgi:hypothetical protein